MHGERQCGRWLISGRVQGVGFRWFVARQAEELGIGGWARNLADGRVEIVGSGPEGAMGAFEAAIGRGPLISRVDSVEKTECPGEVIDHNSFLIK
jgi:acylphosphatase